LRLDGVVTLVDAKHATQHIEEVKPDGVVNEAVEQIAYADRIILNKVSYFEWVLGPMSFSYLELTTARTMVRN
jgi:G3E family GTPase